MKLITILENAEYKVFVDLDGVLAYIEKRLKELVPGYTQNKYNTDKKFRDEMWDAVNNYTKSGGELWFELDLMPDAKKLWNYIKKYDPTILTATGVNHAKTVKDQKERWVKKQLGEVPTICVPSGRDKCKHVVNSKSILIDDQSKSIDPWKAAGGIGILHTSAESTIKQLKELGL